MVTAQMVKELRELSGAGMMDCKKALTEANGDMTRAVEVLREKGLAAVDKKSGRVTAEGLVATLITPDSNTAVIVEVNSETDFVAKNEEFKKFVSRVLEHLVATDKTTSEEVLKETWIDDSSITVLEALGQKIAVIGENLQIRRFDKFEKVDGGKLFSYIHSGGRIGVLLELCGGDDSNEVLDAGKNVCMQIAAMAPEFLDVSEVSEEHLNKEREILLTQAKNEEPNKPEKILKGMVEGRIKKQLKDVCLNEQIYVKDEKGKMTVKEYLTSVAPNLKITRFIRFETGEGIEKKEDNFADEVSKMM